MDTTVVVAGMGGVGSHAALALARSGLGCLVLVDFDVVTPSTLNRHAVATLADVGRLKAEVVHEQIERVHGVTRVVPITTFIDADTIGQLFAGPPAVVIDAIDGLNSKVTLLLNCVEREIPVVSSMGASSRRDPTRVQSGTLDQTTICPLAKHVRKRLRRRGVDLRLIRAVWSDEIPLPSLPPDEDEPRAERGRLRNRLPSLITLPGVFGYTLAAVTLELLTESGPSLGDEEAGPRTPTGD